MNFSSKAREIATVNPRHHEESRQDTMVMRCFKDPHYALNHSLSPGIEP